MRALIGPAEDRPGLAHVSTAFDLGLLREDMSSPALDKLSQRDSYIRATSFWNRASAKRPKLVGTDAV